MRNQNDLRNDLDKIARFLSNTSSTKHKIDDLTASYFMTEVGKLCKKCNSSGLLGNDAFTRSSVWQWLEARVEAHYNDNINMFIKLLNSHLSDYVYLVGHTLTIADVVVFVAIESFVNQLTHFDRQTTYPNLCRWFHNVLDSQGLSNGGEKQIMLYNNVYSQ